jgi:hypothetical protein
MKQQTKKNPGVEELPAYWWVSKPQAKKRAKSQHVLADWSPTLPGIAIMRPDGSKSTLNFAENLIAQELVATLRRSAGNDSGNRSMAKTMVLANELLKLPLLTTKEDLIIFPKTDYPVAHFTDQEHKEAGIPCSPLPLIRGALSIGLAQLLGNTGSVFKVVSNPKTGSQNLNNIVGDVNQILLRDGTVQ